ncbi:MAG TPA: protocatechuate 3,4-dioxygenase subunit alpha [Gaiellaceae bacterium]|nr:protocatechuate 3,4-dioxygenase subunit alpha [Gaiellaceae bacterium]
MPALTPSQTVGPYFALGLCTRPLADVVPPDSEHAVRLGGRVVDGEGNPMPDAVVELWQADEEGNYRGDFGWARCGTDETGSYEFTILKPGRVRGPNGELQAPHLTLLVFARGLLKPVLTRVYFPDEERANEEDDVVAGLEDERERSSLVARGSGAGLRFDVYLQGDDQTVFFTV